jgi:Tol biopolymer transport system component
MGSLLRLREPFCFCILFALLSRVQCTSELEQVTFGPVAELGPQCSPDNRWIVFEYFHESGESRGPQIWMMPESGDFRSARPLIDDGKYHAGISWSPDSQWISFVMSQKRQQDDPFLSSQIYKANIRTGKIVQLTDFEAHTALGEDTAWSQNGLIAFEKEGDIYAIPAVGGAVFKLLDASSQGVQIGELSGLAWSRNGKYLAFSANQEGQPTEDSAIWNMDVQEKQLRQLPTGPGSGCPFWISDSTLLFCRGEKGGAVKIYSYSLRHGRTTELTSGPIDLPGCVVPATGRLFFNHGKSSQLEFETLALPKLHIWKKRLSRSVMRQLAN